LKNMIIGTAGHVDHGKTELVRALTGRDTDRLAEEKERGISIVLGFAPIETGSGTRAGIVDVPGHERFVKNMVAGASGVDVVLMVVAADEGVMPQTLEHFEVLRLLGVSTGVVAVTKTDLVDADIVEVVRSEVGDLLEGSPLEGSPVVGTSVVTGEGMGEVRAALEEAVARAAERRPGDFFRMPVDRVFTRSGIGTIVTGTTWSGEAGRGDELSVEPGGRKVRVREVQSFDTDVERAGPGMRTAVALHGVKKGDIRTGEQLVTPGALEGGSMIDAVVEVSALEGSALRMRQRVRLHHAAAERLGRAVLLGTGRLGPGERGFVQLRLESPAVAAGGDRFVLRTYSPMRVLAGGTVLDPSPGKARGKDEGRVRFLEELASRDPRRIVEALIGRAGASGLRIEDTARFGLDGRSARGAAEAAVSSGRAVGWGERLFGTAVLKDARGRLYAELDEFARGNRLVWGIDREELRARAGLAGSPLFDLLLDEGRSGGGLFFKGGRVRSGSESVEMSKEDRRVYDELESILVESGMRYPAMRDLTASVTRDEGKLVNLLHLLQEEGRAVRLPGEGYIEAGALGRIVEGVRGILEEKGSMSVGDLKDMTGLSRKYAVPILEYLDGEGYTVRRGDARVAGPRLGKGAAG